MAALLTPRPHALNLVDSEPQSADIGCHTSPYVAESAYLKRFRCYGLATVSACCAPGGASGGVKAYEFRQVETVRTLTTHRVEVSALASVTSRARRSLRRGYTKLRMRIARATRLVDTLPIASFAAGTP